MHYTTKRRVKYDEILDKSELEIIEIQLCEEQDLHPEVDISEDLIALYRRMWALSLADHGYETKISQQLMKLGWDMKKMKVNYDKARVYFEELIRMSRPVQVPIAHYRLGFIYYHNQDWVRAISHFERALYASKRIRSQDQPIEKWALLNSSQQFKGSSKLALAYKRQSVEVAKEARELFDLSDDFDSNDIYMEEINKEILVEENQPYICISNQGSYLLSIAEFQRMKQNKSSFVLDCTEYQDKYILFEGDKHRISGCKEDILIKLLSSKRALSQQNLQDKLMWSGQKVRTYINRLREFLKYDCCIQEELIVTDDGYKWSYSDFYLVYCNDDLEFVM